MRLTNVKLVFQRELRDQLRDRRTLFTIAVLPLLLYPLLGMSVLQVAQFMQEHPTRIWVVGAEHLEAIDQQRQNNATVNGPPTTTGAVDLQGEPVERSPLIIQAAGHDASDTVYRFHPDYCLDQADLIILDLDHRSQRDVMSAIEQFALHEDGSISEKELEKFRARVEKELEKNEFDALLYITPGDTTANPQETIAPPQFIVIVNSASDKSRIANERVDAVVERYRRSIVTETLRSKEISERDTEPFEIVSRDIAAEDSRRAAMWSKILPFVMLIWALTGAFYPAIDLCAGEKERGTLETLLSSPAKRAEIVWGKLLTIMMFSMSTALLNLLSMGITGTFLMSQFGSLGLGSNEMPIGPPPITSMGWLLIAMIPVSGLFSALSLAIAAFARSSKEGQYYLMPLLLITLPLMMLPMLPAAELDLGTSLIPVSGMMLLLRSLIEGEYADALRYGLPVMGVTAACCLFAIRWAIDQFNNESVLFRESERLGVGVWFRHMVRDRGMMPTFGEAILCGILILMIKFFASFVAEQPDSWNGFVTVTVVVLLAFVATPALMMAIMLTRSPGRSLMLHIPKGETSRHTRLWWLTLPGAVLLAFCLHPALGFMAQMVMEVYPVSPEIMAFESQFQSYLDDAPGMWAILMVIALTPAICEELAFRGFIFSGLSTNGRKWSAILISSLFFGATHGILQQSIVACFTGLILGYVAYQTRSIFPCMLYHFTHNGLTISEARMNPADVQANPILNFLFDVRTMGADETVVIYSPVAGTLMVLSGIVLLGLLSRLRMRDARSEALSSQSVTAPPVKQGLKSLSMSATGNER